MPAKYVPLPESQPGDDQKHKKVLHVGTIVTPETSTSGESVFYRKVSIDGLPVSSQGPASDAGPRAM